MRKVRKEAEIRLQKMIRARKQYCAKHYIAGLPGATEEEIPKAGVFENATAIAAANGLADHPYFKGSRRRFRTYLENNFGGTAGIRQVAMEDLGCATAFGGKLKGIRRAGKRGAEQTAAWLASVLQTSANVQALYSETAKALLGANVSRVHLKMLNGR